MSLRNKFNPAWRTSNTAFVVIDVQPVFFSPDRPGGSRLSDNVARKIASFVPMIRKQNLPVYAVYYADSSELSDRDFYRYKPAAEDIIVCKDGMSAIDTGCLSDGGDLQDFAGTLRMQGIRNIAICGGYTSDCVKATVIDALELHFNVCLVENLLSDCKGSEMKAEKAKKEMAAKGAHILHARAFYREFEKVRPRP